MSIESLLRQSSLKESIKSTRVIFAHLLNLQKRRNCFFIYLFKTISETGISLALKIIIERFEGKTIFFKQMYLVRPFQSFLEEGA